MAKNEKAPASQPEPETQMPDMPEMPAMSGDDGGFAQIRMNTRDALAKQPKRKVRLIQNPKGQPQMQDETVCINGYIFQLKRGVEVEVPQSVYEILVESGLI